MVEAGKGTYEGKKGTDLIEEKIDEVILRALGLQEVFDLDYDTYKTLLKERMMADRMGQKMDSGEADAVTEEYKRVKTKAGRFRLKTEKIKSDSFRPKTKTGSTAPITDVTKLIPGSAFADVEKPQQIMLPPKKESSNVEKEPKADSKEESKEETKRKKSSSYNFSKIESILDDIAKNLKSAFSFEKDKDKKRNQEEGRKKKKQKESTLEKTMGVVAKIGKKILEPLKGPLDYILNWITYTFLGKVVNNLLNWMSDPANTKKMMSIGRFLEDWWPALVGAYLIFGTSLGRFVSRLAFTIGAFSIKMLTKAIPALLNVIRTNPLAAAAVGGAALFTAGATIPMLFPDTVDEQEKKTDKAVKEKGKDNVKSELERKANNPNFFERLTGQDSEAKEQLYRTETGETKSYRRGGKITSKSGTRVKGAGADTQLIAAQPGEVVINKPAVDALGAPFFLGINKKYGGSGANKPKMAKGVQTASGGGLVVPAFKGGGEVGGRGVTNSGGGGSSVVDNIVKFVKQSMGYDVNKPESWPKDYDSTPSPTSNSSRGKEKGYDFNKGNNQPKTSTGSLLNDPVGAISRMMGIKSTPSKPPAAGTSSSKPPAAGTQSGSSEPKTSTGSLLNDPVGAISRMMGIKSTPSKPPAAGTSSPKPPASKSGTPGFFEEIAQKLTGPGASTYLDAGSIYAKQMLGGFDGPVSERNLGKDSKAELQKAIERAKLRTGVEKAKAEAKIKKLEADGASKTSEGREALAIQRSFLKKLDAGGVRVQYTDYADSKGKMSPAAENAKNILGQFWANKRSKEEGGGYRVEDKYDFDPFTKKVKDPKTGKMVSKNLDTGELIRDKMFGRGVSGRERLQAAFLLNPLKGKGDVDMVLGGKRTAEEEMGLTGSKTLLGGLLGMSGKPKEKNTKALEAKRPWWDKMGMFGGASAEIQRKKSNPYTAPGGIGPTISKSSKPKPKSNQQRLEEKRPWWDKFGMFGGASAQVKKKQGGGVIGMQGGGGMLHRGAITESSGRNIKGATADRQQIFAQPGEYMLPVDAVMNLGGVRNVDRLVAALDSNSNPTKMGAGTRRSIPGPPSAAGKSGMMTLPPITGGSGAGGAGGGGGGGSRKGIPSFSATSSYSGERSNKASIYGIK